jgi:uncharacterized membrane protein
MRSRATLVLVVIVVAVIGIGAIAAVVTSRDDSTVSPGGGPGVARPAGAQPKVEAGNVVLLYSDERLTRRLRELAQDIAGPPDPALVAAGQAVTLLRRPNQRVAVVAVTATRRLDAADPADPALRAFIEFWLGRGSA